MLSRVLLRRRWVVHAGALTPPVRRSAWQWLKRPLTIQAGLSALQAELVQRGVLMSAGLYRYCAGLSAPALAGFGKTLLELLDAELGADVEHAPLFRGFPESVPGNTETLYVNRVFAQLMQEPEQPCVLCGDATAVQAVAPCAHLVCRTCWDGADYSACPLCLSRIDPADPFLQPGFTEVQGEPTTDRLRLLGLATEGTARAVVNELLTRRAPLSATDRDDLRVLLAEADPSWLPDAIPVRETRAVVLAELLPVYPELLDKHVDTATDILRVLTALDNGDPGLRVPPVRRQSLPRVVRRAVLARLNRMPAEALLEDLLRYKERWKRQAESLHPYEYASRYPLTTLGFALVRGTRLHAAAGPVVQAVTGELARHPFVGLEDRRVVLRTFASRVEGAFADGRPEHALDLLVQRPGELMRRLLQVARALPSNQHGALVDAVATAVSDVSPLVLTAALGQVRTPPGDLRLFLPRSGTARIWTKVDDREPLPSGLATALAETITGELVRRAASLPRLRRVFLDEELERIAVPASERGASAGLTGMTRGSAVPIPPDDQLRLFLHWVEPDGKPIDLDLAVVVYDEEWRFLGLCDQSRLRFDQDALVHSGDLQTAPQPDGATEFVDLDPPALRRLGARYVLAVVLSEGTAAFQELERGFVGVMREPSGLFDPAAVEERFELTGRARALLPFGVDLRLQQLRWYDLNLSAAGYGASVAKYAEQLALVGATVEEVHGAGDRVSLWELCCWHAAARSDEVVVRCADETVVGYLRGADEDVAGFARRLTARLEPDRTWDTEAASRADLVAVLTGRDLTPPAHAQIYALHPQLLDPAVHHLIAPAGLLTALSPDTRARSTLTAQA